MATKKPPADVRRRLREEQERQASRQRAKRVKQMAGVVVAVAVVVVAAIFIALGSRSGSSSGSNPGDQQGLTAAAAASVAAGGASNPTPWAVPTNQVDQIKAAGLTPLSTEGTVEHYHAHLDIFVNGSKVPVPADIGIDEAAQKISALHTHDESGVLHIESPTKGEAYYLGQLFREWNVALTADQVGSLHTDSAHTLTAYINGKKVSGNPAEIKLAAHQEIALVYGTADQHVDVPSSYEFGDL
jgi:hypothetical protein